MSKKKYDAVYVVQPTREGDKPRYINCGAVFATEKGFRLKLDSIPVGFNGWLAFYEPKPKDEQQRPAAAPAQQQSKAEAGFDDDIPF